jgi:hypothetical protein
VNFKLLKVIYTYVAEIETSTSKPQNERRSKEDEKRDGGCPE